MVEAIVALSMLAMGMVGMFTLLSSSYAFNRVSTNEYIASNLAAEGIEVVRNIIDANIIASQAWNAGLTGCAAPAGCSVQYDSTSLGGSQGNFLNLDSGSRLYLYDTMFPNTIFKRKLVLENINNPPNNPNPNEIKVISSVSWRDRRLDYSVDLEDHLYDWRSAISE